MSKLHIRAFSGDFFEPNGVVEKRGSDVNIDLKLQKTCVNCSSRSFGVLQKFKIRVKHQKNSKTQPKIAH